MARKKTEAYAAILVGVASLLGDDIPLGSRILLLTSTYTGEHGCYLSDRQLGEILGAKPPTVRKTIKRLVAAGKLDRVEGSRGRQGRGGFRVRAPEPVGLQDRLKALNKVSGKYRYVLSPDDVKEAQEELREGLDSHKRIPQVYLCAGDLEDLSDDLAAHWTALDALWGMTDHEYLLRPNDKRSRTWWLSLSSNVAKNPYLTRMFPGHGREIDDLRIQGGLLLVGDHVARKVRNGRWKGATRNAGGLLCTMLQTLKPGTKEEVRGISPVDIRADMSALQRDPQAQTVAEQVSGSASRPDLHLIEQDDGDDEILDALG